MEREQALKILNALANGVHPATGEVFAADSPYQHPDTVRALFEAVRAIGGARGDAARAERARTAATCPPTRSCAGRRRKRSASPRASTRAGRSAELAKLHNRSRAAIEARLLKIGKIDVVGADGAAALSAQDRQRGANVSAERLTPLFSDRSDALPRSEAPDAISTTLIAASDLLARHARGARGCPAQSPASTNGKQQREGEQPVGEHEPGEDEDDEADAGAEEHHRRKRGAHRALVLEAPREIDRVRRRADAEERAHRPAGRTRHRRPAPAHAAETRALAAGCRYPYPSDERRRARAARASLRQAHEQRDAEHRARERARAPST